jgi:hypothetical protein
MRGIETVVRFESNERIAALPWELRKQRIVFELMKQGMGEFEIQGELDGMVSKREVSSIILKLKLLSKGGDYEPRTRRELQRHAQKRVGSKDSIRYAEDWEAPPTKRTQGFLQPGRNSVQW